MWKNDHLTYHKTHLRDVYKKMVIWIHVDETIQLHHFFILDNDQNPFATYME